MTGLMYMAQAVHMSAFLTAITLTTWSTATCIIHMEIIVMITGPLPCDASHDSARDYSQAAREKPGIALMESFGPSVTGSSHGRGRWVNSIN
jgi:hypothetical protein